VHVAVDARDLDHDWRGIGRYVRAVLAAFARRDDVRVTLVRRGPFGQRAPRDADVVWHPWNGTFFRAGAPAVVTFHDAVPFRFPAADPRKRENDVAPWRRSAATGAAFIANSHFTASEIERFLAIPPARQTVIPLAVDREVFVPDGTRAALPDGRPYVLFAGAAEPRKNFATLASAHARAFPDRSVALAVAGDRPPAEAGAITLGVLEPAELARWYRGAAIVAVPSLYEGFGFPLLEALACGAPAIASRASSLPEVGATATFWVDEPRDVDRWAAALREVAADGALRERLRAAGPTRAQAFSWDRCAEETLAVLRRTAYGT
jgi:glycosyltransferase involved in cell wall biosynthesis